jgi:hypothetical protein
LKGSYVVLLGCALECLMLCKLGCLLNNKLGLHHERVYGVGLLLLLSDSHQYFILGWYARSDVMVVGHNLFTIAYKLDR